MSGSFCITLLAVIKCLQANLCHARRQVKSLRYKIPLNLEAFMANCTIRSLFCLRTLAAVFALCIVTSAWSAESPKPTAHADLKKGKELAEGVCGACHNPDGNSVVPTFPKLAGQSADYLVKQLTELATPPAQKNSRENAVMSGIAGTLSAEDRINVSAWFASQPAWSTGAASDKLAARDGQRLYRAGYPAKAVPACAGCHGPSGAGLPARFPRLGGQHADYIESQLKAYRDGTRHNSEVMGQIAFRLSDPEIKALSQYITGLHNQ